jgi:hypothetical protein
VLVEGSPVTTLLVPVDAAGVAAAVAAGATDGDGDAAKADAAKADAAPNARMRSAPPATIVPAIATVSLGFRMSVSCSGFCGDALLSSELQD